MPRLGESPRGLARRSRAGLSVRSTNSGPGSAHWRRLSIFD